MKDYKDMARDVLRRRDEYLKEKKRKQRMAIGITASVLCLFLAVATPFAVMKLTADNSKIPNSLPPEVNSEATDSAEVTDKPETNDSPDYTPKSPIYVGEPNSTSAESFVMVPSYNTAIVRCSDHLMSCLEEKNDDDLFAVAVALPKIKHTDSPETAALKEKDDLLKEELHVTAQECVEQLVEELGISVAEAQARKFTHPDFIAAREKYREAHRAYYAAFLEEKFDVCSDAFYALLEYGFEVEYTALDTAYQSYLYGAGCIGVVVGTKAEIIAFTEAEADTKYVLYGADPNAAEKVPSDPYLHKEIYLDDSGLSEALLEKYAESAPGTKLLVDVVLALRSSVVYETIEELNQAALDAIGANMTWWEFNEAVNLDKDLIDRYREAKNRIIYNKDFNERVAAELFYDGEIKEIQNWKGSILAELTYERALEIAQSEDVAYIHIADEIQPTYYGDDLIELE